jgi:hypothetical protein
VVRKDPIQRFSTTVTLLHSEFFVRTASQIHLVADEITIRQRHATALDEGGELGGVGSEE